MADNVTLPGTGAPIASDDIGGIQYQRSKIVWGPDGTANDADVATGKPLPTQLRTSTGSEIQFQASGPLAKAASTSVTLATDEGGEYETVAASQTAQILGPTGATGDFIEGVLVVPASTSPGNVLLLDNAISITIFAGGATSVSNLVPFYIPLGMRSVSGAWKITTGANVSVIGVGTFT